MCERNERNALAPRAILEAAMAPWEGKALQRAETAAERFGLRLSPEAYERLGEERRRAQMCIRDSRWAVPPVCTWSSPPSGPPPT